MESPSNNHSLPHALTDLIDAFSALPGVGRKTAERYAYACLKGDKAKSLRLASCLEALHNGVKRCPITFALIDSSDNVSPLYDSPTRDKATVAVVEDPFDVLAIEATGQFTGTYHVLGGVISPIDGVGPEELNIQNHPWTRFIRAEAPRIITIIVICAGFCPTVASVSVCHD